MTNISICGCGWLGQPLAYQLLQQGYRVLGTCRNEHKQKKLSAEGIEAWLFELGNALPDAITAADICILNIPPNRRTIEPVYFVHAIKRLTDQLLSKGCRQILFISTTSVYGNNQGRVNEQRTPEPNTASGIAHMEIERHLLSTGNASILRLAGLIGPNRHPVKFLAGRTLDKGHQRVNLVHLEDVLQAINAIIEGNHRGQIFHLSATAHPTRQDFYCHAAKQAGLPLPVFTTDEDSSGPGKEIDASATLRQLGISLKYPDPMQMPVQLS
jgi:nucleoside-diphosphate-sugar epimerase